MTSKPSTRLSYPWPCCSREGFLPCTPIAYQAARSIRWLAFTNNRSGPLPKKKADLSRNQTTFLQILARKTWTFFEKFAGPEDNWLPPDNYQEHPAPVVARRTSPTNIGLSLLANLTAYDFGYITGSQLLERTRNTFTTLEKMEKFRGHLYNWYDTETLQILPPRYVSTVDSGNLAGHLLTLRQGLMAIPGQKIIKPKLF